MFGSIIMNVVGFQIESRQIFVLLGIDLGTCDCRVPSVVSLSSTGLFSTGFDVLSYLYLVAHT